MALREQGVVKQLFKALLAGDADACDALIVGEYVQHNPQVANSRHAVRVLRLGRPVDVEVYRMIGEGDLVAVHSHYKSFNIAGVDKQTSPSVTRPITPPQSERVNSVQATIEFAESLFSSSHRGASSVAR